MSRAQEKHALQKHGGTLASVFEPDLPLANRLVSVKSSGFTCLQVALHERCKQKDVYDAAKEQEKIPILSHTLQSTIPFLTL